MKAFLLIVCCMTGLFSAKGYGQAATQTDSLLRALANAPNDTNKVKLLLLLGDQYQSEENDFSASKYYYRQAGYLSKQLHYSAGVYNYLFYYLDVLVQQSRYDSSLIFSRQARDLAMSEKDSLQLEHALFTTGVSYSGLEQYDKAVEYYLQALTYYEQTKNNGKIATCYNELMIAYRGAGQYKQAINYGEKAVVMYRLYKSPGKATIPLENLAVVYQSMQKPKLAAPLLRQSLVISKQFHAEFDELPETINLVDLQFHMNSYGPSTKNYIRRALFLSRKLGDKESECGGLAEAGTYYLLENDFHKASLYADSALQIALQTNTLDLKQQCYALLSKIAYGRRDYHQAAEYDKQLELVRQEINTAGVSRNITELQTKYETEKKETQIRTLKTEKQVQELSLQKRKILIVTLLVIIVALLAIGWLFYTNNQRKQKLIDADKQLQEQHIAALEQEKQLLASQAMLQGQEEERTRLARDLHDGLGGILSSARYALNDMKENTIMAANNVAAFEKTMAMLDQSISELRRIAHNMMPEGLQKQELGDALRDFCSQVSSSGAISIDYYDVGMENQPIVNTVKITAYRIVQELVSNIIKHAGATSAIVQVIAKDNLLRITVEDNGKGFNKDQLNEVAGIGYRNIYSRIGFLKGRIDLGSQPGEGTSVYIEIPF